MKAEVIVQIGGQDVERFEEEINGLGPEREEQAHALSKRTGRVLIQSALQERANEIASCCCDLCGRRMRHKGLRSRDVLSVDGGIRVSRVRYRCEREGDGPALWEFLIGQRGKFRGAKQAAALEALIRYTRNNVDRMDYGVFKFWEWQIGTGMIESTNKQLVSHRLKGAGMKWSDAGALAMTALRAQSLNARWHEFWATNPQTRTAA